MPGEKLDDALWCSGGAAKQEDRTVFTHLAKTLGTVPKPNRLPATMVKFWTAFREKGLQAEISVKLTQLGLDLSPELVFEH